MKYYSYLAIATILLFSNCKKEEKDDGQFKGKYTLGGVEYSFIPELSQCAFGSIRCLSFTGSGQPTWSDVTGLNLVLFTEYANTNNKGMTLSLSLKGNISVGDYDDLTSLCNEYSLSTDSYLREQYLSYFTYFKSPSYVKLTKVEGKKISGNFKIKITPDPKFQNDSFIVGEFKNLTYN